MENPYIQQYPELMSGKTVLYVHGFASSGQSGTVARLREVMPNAHVIAPDLPLHPDEAIALLQDICQKEQPHLIIGTSMGGMYAERLYGYARICVNPALQMGDTMKSHGMIGAQTFQNPRQDGVQEFIVTKALAKEYKDFCEHCFEGVTDDEQSLVYGLFGDEDTTVDGYADFHDHYRQALHFHGEHRMNDKSFMHSVLPVIRWIDDSQEQRERPIIYIGTETLADSYNKPTSSMAKAIRMLIEHYQVYFVAPSPSSDAAEYAVTTDWLTQYVGVPTWGHTVFTNQRHLLYGDYLIAREKTPDTMATLLEYGSDTFKTWEEVIEYFSRLGGQ